MRRFISWVAYVLSFLHMPEKGLNDLIYEKAFESLGKDNTPEDRIPDELSCVDQLSTIVSTALEGNSKFPIMYSTRSLFEYLSKSPSWKSVELPRYGDIILSVTGEGNGSIAHGHCGILGKKTSEDGSLWIMSNDSRNGIWSANYTVASWHRYFAAKGGMYSHFFRFSSL